MSQRREEQRLFFLTATQSRNTIMPSSKKRIKKTEIALSRKAKTALSVPSYRYKRVRNFVILFIGGLTFVTLNARFEKKNSATTNGRELLSIVEPIDAGNQYPTDILLSSPYAESDHKYLMIFHVIGIVYMFTGLSIVCDEYFVMALEEMVDRWGIMEDVAGATFMAAGGSAPELFTSIMGVFVSKDDVGFGTIVGSAVFNVLFVIGLCAVFAKEPLSLTWWPLFRDCSFYAVSLVVLVIVIRDDVVHWYEAILLFLMYLLYVSIMFKNLECRQFIERLSRNTKKKWEGRNSIVPTAGGSKKARDSNKNKVDGKKEVATSALMRKVRSVALRTIIQHRLCKAVASEIEDYHDSFETLSPDNQFSIATACVIKGGKSSATIAPVGDSEDTPFKKTLSQVNDIRRTTIMLEATDGIVQQVDSKKEGDSKDSGSSNAVDKEAEECNDDDDDDGSPFDIPEGFLSRLLWLSTLPLVCLLHVTIPRCDEDHKKKWLFFTFFNSLIWIAVFTYCMVWWATVIGEALKIPTVVMGVTVLAAGTSIPDALSSVVVARRGFGDMAVSSSIGSNVFDILVGLPIPWIIKTCFVDQGSTISILSPTLVVSVTTLLSMVILVICSIIYTKWILDKKLGIIMFVLYIVFVIQTLLLAAK